MHGVSGALGALVAVATRLMVADVATTNEALPPRDAC